MRAPVPRAPGPASVPWLAPVPEPASALSRRRCPGPASVPEPASVPWAGIGLVRRCACGRPGRPQPPRSFLIRVGGHSYSCMNRDGSGVWGGEVSRVSAATAVVAEEARVLSGRATASAVPVAEAAPGLDGLGALLARLDADAAVLAALPLGDLDGPQAAAARAVLRLVGDRVQVASATLLAAVEADGRWASGGADRTVAGWAARREGIAYGTARREATLGRALGELSTAKAAVLAGQITAAHADVLAEVAMSSPVRQAAVHSDLSDRNEAFLVTQASRLPVDEFRKAARRWAVAVDGRAAEREHTQAAARESLVFTRRRDGVAFTGFLTHEHGELVTTAVRAVAGVPAKDDDRSLEQRQAAALTGVARLVLDQGLSAKGAQIRPHLNVLVSYETLERLAEATAADPDRTGRTAAGVGAAGAAGALGATGGAGARGAAGATGAAGASRAVGSDDASLLAPAELVSGEPIPHSVLARIACDSELTRIVFGPGSQVLDVGRAERTYTRQLRRAVIARDRHCRYPGCTAPPTLSEVHHIQWWARHGPTSLSNGILLCWHHHDHVHRHDLTITRHGADRGGGQLTLDPAG